MIKSWDAAIEYAPHGIIISAEPRGLFSRIEWLVPSGRSLHER
ncbi:hypothetical protein QUF95_26330 [Paenibacillus silvae]|nr:MULTISPECIES: hypothetical protein [Paenibacillus]MDM5280875.1 hypothetical protein [Paenibacillus silvae]